MLHALRVLQRIAGCGMEKREGRAGWSRAPAVPLQVAAQQACLSPSHRARPGGTAGRLPGHGSSFPALRNPRSPRQCHATQLPAHPPDR